MGLAYYKQHRAYFFGVKVGLNLQHGCFILLKFLKIYLVFMTILELYRVIII